MGSIVDKMAYLDETKGQMRDVINAYKSGEKLSDTTPFRDYVPVMAEILASGGTSDYNSLTNRPSLNTNNTTSLTAGLEVIENVINLHKVSKTGNYNDLIGKPTIHTGTTEPAANLGVDGDIYIKITN